MTRDRITDVGPCPARRVFLRGALRIAAGGAALVCLPVLPGCGDSAPSEDLLPLRLSLTELPVGSRKIFWQGEDPVEVQRTAEQITARSLLCTHRGCVVVWREDTETYDCPCHEGRFDAAGKVILGPPPRPLRELSVTRDGDMVVIGV